MALSSIARPKVQILTAEGGDAVYDFPLAERGVLMRVHRFTSSGDFEVAAGAGLIEAIIHAGGGGGAGTTSRGSGGGGAGGFLLETFFADSTQDVGSGDGVYPIVVGNGGAGGASSAVGATGSNTTAFGFTAFGGGGGQVNNTGTLATNGGSGGRGNGNPGSGTLGQGAHGSSGGLNIDLAFDGTVRRYSKSGISGGRNGNTTAQRAVSEYGAGGQGSHGSDQSSPGGAGAQGIVIIRYPVRSL